MEVTFNFAENITFSDVLNSLKESAQHKGADENGNEIYVIRDDNYGFESKVSVKNKADKMVITTFSGYTYTIKDHESGPYVRYKGAYRGLLEHCLIPSIMKGYENLELKSLQFASVKNSLGGFTEMSDYVELQQNLHIMRCNDVRCESNYHAHPNVIYEMIKAGMFPDLPKLERYEAGESDIIVGDKTHKLRNAE